MQTGRALAVRDFKWKQLREQSGNKHTETIAVALNRTGRLALSRWGYQRFVEMVSAWLCQRPVGMLFTLPQNK